MILVTGATGHIGNVLVRKLLQEGHAVRVLSRNKKELNALHGLEVEIVSGNLNNAESLVRACDNIEVVYHLAGFITILPFQRQMCQLVNVQGTKNVIEACRKSGVKKLLYAGSIHCFEEPPHGTPFTENLGHDPDNIVGEYGKSKAMATSMVLENNRDGLETIVLCPSAVFGPFDFKPSSMGHTILEFYHGKIPAYLEGGYDFVDVRDVANGMFAALKKGKGGEAYLLGGNQLSIYQVMQMLGEVTGKKPPRMKLPVWLAKISAYLALPLYLLFPVRPVFTPFSIHTLQTNSEINLQKSRKDLDYSVRDPKETYRDAFNWFKENGYLK